MQTQRLPEDLVYVLTEAGRVELRERRILTEQPQQFLLMLINGERPVAVIRVFSPLARQSDAALHALAEAGLIAARPAPAPSEHPQAEHAHSDIAHRASPEEASPVAPASIDAAAADIRTADAPDKTTSDPAAAVAAKTKKPAPESVLQAVALLQHALGKDADPLVARLSKMEDAEEFHGFVRRLEENLRRQVSVVMAEDLRSRIPGAFSPAA